MYINNGTHENMMSNGAETAHSQELRVSVHWVDSAKDRNYWRALVNAALNLRVP